MTNIYVYRWAWNQWLCLPIQFCDIPKDAVLCLNIFDCNGPNDRYPIGNKTLACYSKLYSNSLICL